MDKNVMIACMVCATSIILCAVIVLGIIADSHDGSTEAQVVTGLLGFLGMIGVGVSTLLGHQFGARAATTQSDQTTQKVP